jgi:hypothetical protein
MQAKDGIMKELSEKINVLMQALNNRPEMRTQEEEISKKNQIIVKMETKI